MKNLFKLIFLFIVIICISSCCKELYFDEDETFWTDTYENGDKLIFKSDRNHFDTIFITSKTKFTPKGDCNMLVSNYDKEGCVIEYAYKHDTIMSDSDLFIQHFKENDGPSFPILRVYGTEFSGEKLKDTTIILSNNNQLNDCYTFQSKLQYYNGWSNFNLKTFVWSRKIGLAVLIGQNGEKFELYRKLRKK